MLDQATKSCGISLSYRTPSFPASRPNGHGTLHLAKNAPLTGIRRCHPEMYAANRRIWVFAPSHWEYPAFHPCIPVLLSVPPCAIGGKVFRRSILRKTSQASATAGLYPIRIFSESLNALHKLSSATHRADKQHPRASATSSSSSLPISLSCLFPLRPLR